MALTVRLQDENGKVIEEMHDTRNEIVTRLPSLSDESYHCLRFIDPYGDTYFNRLQMTTFLAEWDRVFSQVERKEVKALYVRIKTLAHQCQREPHLYLVFVGD